jgi:hypothetical protein
MGADNKMKDLIRLLEFAGNAQLEASITKAYNTA